MSEAIMLAGPEGATVHNLGAPQLRAVVRVMRKHGKLARRLSGADVSLLKSDGAVALIEESRAAGKVTETYLAGLVKWAVGKMGNGPSEGAEAEADGAEEEAPPAVVAQSPAAGDTLGALRAALAGVLDGAITAKGVDAAAVNAIVTEALAPWATRIETLEARPPLAIVVKTEHAERKIEGRTHKRFPLLVKTLAAGCAPMLVGPAGSGKTQACHQAATSLDLEFRFTSVCSQTTASALLGYLDATGTYRGTAFRHCYEHGGVFLLDEIDNGNPNVLAVLNAALANSACEFPDGKIARHANFRLCAAANTWGNGRTVEYVGRNPIDAATLDRFVQLAWQYDDELERDVSGNEPWARHVQAFRAEITKRGTRHMVTPRATFYGAKLLAAGLTAAEVTEITLTRGLDESTASSVLSAVGAFKGGR